MRFGGEAEDLWKKLNESISGKGGKPPLPSLIGEGKLPTVHTEEIPDLLL